jgi:hypothetical protein
MKFLTLKRLGKSKTSINMNQVLFVEEDKQNNCLDVYFLGRPEPITISAPEAKQRLIHVIRENSLLDEEES